MPIMPCNKAADGIFSRQRKNWKHQKEKHLQRMLKQKSQSMEGEE